MTDRRLLNITAALAALACASAEAVVFVHSGATGANDGSSWANAFTDLQNAIAAPGATEIWVAAGAYKPGAPGDTTASFTLRSGLALYGGFAGFESAREQRRPDVNATTLSGDLDGDGATGPGNSAHVVRASGTDTTALLDGFTISGGYAVQAAYPGSSGAGIFIENGTVTLRSCAIRNHIAQLGAGLLAYNATLTIEDCRFENNLASQGRGGAIYVSGDTGDAVLHPLTLRRCTFTANTATGTGADGYGGGLYAEFDAPVDVSECVFIGNESRWRFASGQSAASGGAALTFADGCKFDRCLFRGNRSHNGGALWLAGNTTLSNCLFVGNEAYRVSAGAYDYGGYGGAIIAYTANVTVAGSTLHANRARSTGGIYVDINSSALVTNSILWSNTATEEDQKPLDPQIGGASPFTIRYSCVRDLLTPIPGEDPPDPARFPGCIVIDPLFVSERGLDNIAGNADDNLQLRDNSPCLDAGNNTDILVGATLDFVGTSRRHDVVAKADTGSGFAPITDMGAYEWEPPFLSTLASGAPSQLTLSWSALGAGWQYTAEWTGNIDAPDWQPVPPANQWPSTSTGAAIDTAGMGASAFFRIHATLINP